MTAARLLLLAPALTAVTAPALDFKKDIQPVLKARCYECHSEAAKKEKSGYVFDNLERFSGDIGPKGQIVPGDPGRSNLLDLVSRSADRMPPEGREPLSPGEIKRFRQWIEAGARLDGGSSGAKPAGSLPPPAAPPAPLLKWTNREGKTIQARCIRLSGEAVILKNAAGKSFKVPLSSLDAASAAQAKAAAP